MLTTIEEKMKNRNMMALGDAATFWYHSRAYYSPGQWLPNHIVRHYTSSNVSSDDRRKWKTGLLVFIAIYLAPEKFQEPIIVWGSALQEETKNFWNILKSLGLYTDNPEFLTQVPALEWEQFNSNSSVLTEFKYQSDFLVNINDATSLEARIIKPLLEEFNRLN